MKILTEPVRAPEIRASAWLNTAQPVIIRQQPRQVTLVDFWDYSCINCLHTLPYLREWHRRYQPLGLVIVGVHTPEFGFGQHPDNVRRAVAELAIPYPVAIDDGHATWNAYANRAWPAKYLVDAQGKVRAFHYGEGEYLPMEREIQVLLRELHPNQAFPQPMSPVRPQDEPGALCYPVTPELYLGCRRGRLGNPEPYRAGQTVNFTLPRPLRPDEVALLGQWRCGDECVETVDSAESRILLQYRAAAVNLVMEASGSQPIEVLVLKEDAPLPQSDWGEDVRLNDQDLPAVSVQEPRLYRLVRRHRQDDAQLTLICRSPGLAAYAFTFVGCVSEETALA
jgi:thiol-disulfide isomerase/thioredoxin